MFLGGFFSLLVLVGVAVVVVWLVSGGDGLSTRRPGSGDERDTPLEILKKRYARGEINRDQFEQMKQDLLDDGRSDRT
jgi:putative membrane protein